MVRQVTRLQLLFRSRAALDCRASSRGVRLGATYSDIVRDPHDAWLSRIIRRGCVTDKATKGHWARQFVGRSGLYFILTFPADCSLAASPSHL